ncbi:Bromodomain-domain-containing protein [Fistulina hepatica ATCC 64428]|uniref:histone acetyltransferase n=1 Tax=Fistulina hepatica ATCC 64428 TaxID=1128425 RepID=A0A0D7AGT9_9AGAR|nr:Bromodomain-domain-containing protein [Fistulina hepatica ATCC 64428]
MNNPTHKAPAVKVKVEDKLDEAQLDRLATGIAVDAAVRDGSPAGPREKLALVELKRGIIQIVPVENDRTPRMLVLLTGLKTLFQKQLPEMPREYIARLVYDSNSKALAIVKRGLRVVGGICYRPFPHRGFMEIVFLATASVDQVKGYGSTLMDHFKAHVRKTYPHVDYFLTYADNYAVGYFEKQGFSKEISLDRSIWAGYIKDYEGGTIMQCKMVPKVDYPKKAEMLVTQQEAIMNKIRRLSKSHIVYPGLPQFRDGALRDLVLDPADVPGLRESGWTKDMTVTVRRHIKQPKDIFMERLLEQLKNHGSSWPFMVPVDREHVPTYYETIKNPMDYSTMENKLNNKGYDTVDAFLADCQLIFDNARIFNAPDSIFYKQAQKLDKFVKNFVATERPKLGC